jgi:hypothetical protein
VEEEEESPSGRRLQSGSDRRVPMLEDILFLDGEPTSDEELSHLEPPIIMVDPQDDQAI